MLLLFWYRKAFTVTSKMYCRSDERIVVDLITLCLLIGIQMCSKSIATTLSSDRGHCVFALTTMKQYLNRSSSLQPAMTKKMVTNDTINVV